MHFNKSFLAVICASGITLSATAVNAENNMLVILDASNSMWGKVDGVAKIETARGVVSDLLTGLPPDLDVGLMAYGHRDKESCTDVEMLSGIGKPDVAAMEKKIAALKPMGKTPIAYSMILAGKELGKYKDDTNNVILVSDGIETCEGDPCAIAASLAKNNIHTKVHVVGFDVDAAARKQLECIAEKGGGKYYNADSVASLKVAMAEVKKVAMEAPQPAPMPEWDEYYKDDFDGTDLSDAWEVMNPDPNNFIVEDGKLVVIINKDMPGLYADDKLANIFKLLKPLPPGDWRVTVRLIPDVQTFRERISLGLYKDKDNMLLGTVGDYNKCCGYNGVEALWSNKVAGGEKTGFTTELAVSENLGPFRSGTDSVKTFTNWFNEKVKAIELRLEKKGRNYVVSAKLEGPIVPPDKEPQWVTLQELTSLRLPGDALVLALRQDNEVNPNYHVVGGESTVTIDWIKVEVPKKEGAEST